MLQAITALSSPHEIRYLPFSIHSKLLTECEWPPNRSLSITFRSLKSDALHSLMVLSREAVANSDSLG